MASASTISPGQTWRTIDPQGSETMITVLDLAIRYQDDGSELVLLVTLLLHSTTEIVCVDLPTLNRWFNTALWRKV